MKARAVLASVALFTRCAITIAQTPMAHTSTSDADFTVGDIRVEGLQRVSEGTVYNYLPVNIGDHLNATRVREAIRAL
jgi:outer membrane protein insertion porin family